jgi:hypothetical protein
MQGLPPRKVLGLCWRNRKHLGVIGGRYRPPGYPDSGGCFSIHVVMVDELVGLVLVGSID